MLTLMRSGESIDINVPITGIVEVTPTPLVTPNPQNIDLDVEEMDDAKETMEVLEDVIVPINDPIDLAGRLAGRVGVPTQLIDEDAPYDAGAQKDFWVTNVDTNETRRISATLEYVGENLYFWIQDGVNFNVGDLNNLASTFDQEIVPTNREFFGIEWNPGVDGDPRFYVLYAKGLGRNLAGYYSSADQLHPDAHPYSNAHEMFLLNADTVKLYEDYTYGTLAHEFQHMIHWYQDKNEETWVNEGFSMLAEHINGLDAGGFDWDYMRNPDLQLNDWGGDVGSNAANYGASYLFMVYFLDRFGEEATKALVSHDENGFTSIDAVMSELNIVNPTTSLPYTGKEVFADWAVANWLQNTGIEDDRYDYQSYSPYPMSATETHYSCPTTISGDVYQFGVDYIELKCTGLYKLTFSGSEAVSLLPFAAPGSGEYYFWSNLGDESNMRLSQEFDFSGVVGPIELTFQTWYDIEEDYDYVYISATTDGVNWEILPSRNCTSENPSGNSYGCGWNGQTNRWIDESVNLSQFAGQKVTLQFDYVTDAAVNGKGMAIDEIAINAIGYFTDLENDAGGWEAEGFARVQNRLPQTFAVSVIRNSNPITVEHYYVDAGEDLVLESEIGEDVESVIVVISGATLITREKATYVLEIK
ncbi:MAG: hypothetical protein GX797_02150 [Chloroflexi bacterium]|nr:hypothetical protein [Chloroflexota bacterium]